MTSGFELALTIIIAIVVGIFFTGWWFGQSDFKTQAVQHGYAEYCSTTGNWSWIGECER